MMKYEEAIRIIESNEFSARVNIASNLRMFLLCARKEEAYKEIEKKIKTHDQAEKLLNRIWYFIRKKFNPEYENPWDTALAVYIDILSRKKVGEIKEISLYLNKNLNFWWARIVAKSVLAGLIDNEKVKIQYRGGRQYRPVHGVRPPDIEYDDKNKGIFAYVNNTNSTSGSNFYNPKGIKESGYSFRVKNFASERAA